MQMNAIMPKPKLAFAAAMGSATAATLLGCASHDVMTHVSAGLSLIEHFTHQKPDAAAIEAFFQGGRDHLAARAFGTLAMFPFGLPDVADLLTPDLVSRLAEPVEHFARAISAGRAEAMDETVVDRSKDFWARLEASSGMPSGTDGATFDGSPIPSPGAESRAGGATSAPGTPSSPTFLDIARQAVGDLETILRAWGAWSVAWKVFSKIRGILSPGSAGAPDHGAGEPGQEGPASASDPTSARDLDAGVATSEDPIPARPADNLNHPPPPPAARRPALRRVETQDQSPEMAP